MFYLSKSRSAFLPFHGLFLLPLPFEFASNLRHPFATCTQHNADPDLYPASTLLTFAFAKMTFGGYPFFPGMGNQGYYDYCQGQGYDPGYGYGYNNMPEGAIRPRDPNEPYDVHSEWIGDMPLAEWQDQQDHYYQ